MKKPGPKYFGTGLFLSVTNAESDVDSFTPVCREPKTAFDRRVDGDPEGFAVPADPFVFADICRAQLSLEIGAEKEVTEAVVVHATIVPIGGIDAADLLDPCPNVRFFEDFALESFFVMFADLDASAR